ncbi:MAG: hypothetical protein HN576_06810 [Bacteriovoracaceae bacterium]|jgi:hypothetical protein|nr:hypothetical protein [Bacteriovoracaceae bacterium]
MKVILLIFSIISMQQAFGLACTIDAFATKNSLRQVSSLVKVTTNVVSGSVCDEFGKLRDYSKDKKKFEKLMNTHISNQTNRIWKIKDRHKMGRSLNQCSPKKETKALVITFAGTGAYNPRSHILMAELVQCKNYQYMPYSLKKMAYTKIFNGLKKKNQRILSGLV